MINWDQVKQLEDDIGAEDFGDVVVMFIFGDVVVMFIEEVDEAVDNLRAKAELTAQELASAMHFLKGSAANLGFNEFSEMCSRGEKSAESGVRNDVDIPQVIALYDASKLAFLTDVSVHTSYIP